MEKSERKALKKQFSSLGWVLLLVLLAMNVCVYLVGIVDVLILMVTGKSSVLDNEAVFSDYLMQNGWGYLITIALGMLVIGLWKGKKFCFKEIWKRGRPMTGGTFWLLLSVFLGSQLFFQFFAMALEAFLNQFGLSAMDDLESATMISETISMYLYVCVGAPIWEELLFRGLILRVLEPHGKRFAVILSALLFGFFHANLVQIPFAFVVGLVLGYVTVEYNIGWAMVLHMINNLVLADFMYRLSDSLPAGLGDGITGLVILIFAIVGIIALIVNRKEIKAYRKENPLPKRKLAYFFTSAGIIGCLVVLIGFTVFPLIMQMV